MQKKEFHGDMEALSNEDKILIVNGWDLLEKTQERASKVRGMDMTWRFQLRSDCKAMEKALQNVEKSPSEKNLKQLGDAYLRLKTSAENILGSE